MYQRDLVLLSISGNAIIVPLPRKHLRAPGGASLADFTGVLQQIEDPQQHFA